jgi:hypothetical protein
MFHVRSIFNPIDSRRKNAQDFARNGKLDSSFGESCHNGAQVTRTNKESLSISDWHYGLNWPYIDLSRVTTLKGLFLVKALQEDVDFSHDSCLVRVLT